MKKGLSEIIVIADRSGSMGGIIDESRNSINRFIEEQKAVEGEAKFTFAMFDDVYDRMIDREDLGKVKPIGDSYNARGMTALLDAVGKTLNYVGDELNKTKEDDKPEHVIVAIVTDGLENASKEFKKKQIAEMIKKQQEQYKWEFFFFGANIDSFAEGMDLNIPQANITNYDSTDEGVRCAYTTMGTSTTRLRTGK